MAVPAVGTKRFQEEGDFNDDVVNEALPALLEIEVNMM